MSLPELVERAEVITVGRLARSEGEWHGTRILTRHVIAPTELWKGPIRLTPEIDVTTLGGVVGELGQWVSGQVDLPIGAELALFLVWDRESRSYRIVGMAQGVFNVKREPAETNGLVIRDQFAPVLLNDTPIVTYESLRETVLRLSRGG